MARRMEEHDATTRMVAEEHDAATKKAAEEQPPLCTPGSVAGVIFESTRVHSRSHIRRCVIRLHSKSGARNVYANVVKPMLDEAGIEHDAVWERMD